jgi:flagellar hook-basal body complex protein FliE
MNEAIAAIAAVGAPATPGVAPAAAPAGGFGDLVVRGLQEVDSRIQLAEADASKLAVGQADNLHTVMIRMEEAKLSLQLMAQVRNRLLEAYQEVMRMQV